MTSPETAPRQVCLPSIAASARCRRLLNLEPTRVADSAGSTVGRCPTDQMTSFILEEWDDADSFRQLAERASSGSTTPDDAAKCRALAARLDTTSGRRASLILPAR